MNSDTGHLVRDLEMVPPHLRAGYERLPADLHGAAERKLAGRDEAYVSRRSGGKLSRFAARTRRKKADKRRQERQSRARNRGR